MKRQTVLTTIAIIAIGMIVFFLTQKDALVLSPWWQRAEGFLTDSRLSARGAFPPDTNIVLVGVETASLTLDRLSPEEIEASPTLQEMNKPYPWDRRVFAATVEKLIKAGAKVVVLDFVFANPGSEEGDKIFAETLAKYRDQVVIGSMIEPTEGKYVPPDPGLIKPGVESSIGLVNLKPDPDGVTRRGRYRTSMEREDWRLGKFASQYKDNLLHMSALAVKKLSGTVETPPYDHNNIINFQGPQGTYRPFPIENLFVEKLWNNPPLNGDQQFVGKIVIVGPMANIFHDVHQTPFDEMPGPEIQAQMMATLLNQSSLQEPSSRYNSILTFGMVVIALGISLLIANAALKPILGIGMVAGFWWACQFALNKGGLMVHMMPPLVGFVTTGFFALTIQFFLEQIERRRTRNVLVRYVSRNVANLILEDRASFEEAMRGQKKFVTILFSDIRGFTSMTEGADAEKLVKQLNEYFEEMVSRVDEVDGTLQKFIGDAIMAAWGDTRTLGPQEDARRAVASALRMREALAMLNAQWKGQKDRTELEIGIGVNFGEAVVGKVGSKDRHEFTAMGDVVNLAARLETATKQFHTDVLIGESVEELTRDHFIFRKVGLLTVKGKAKPVEAFAVLSDRTKPVPEWLKLYHEGIDMFRRREFEQAKERFKLVLAQNGGQDFLCEMYIEWSSRYQKSPPPITWAGNFVLKDK